MTRFGASATLLIDGRVLIAGGSNATDVTLYPTAQFESTVPPLLTIAELYDPTMGGFVQAGNMTQPRSRHTATLLADGRVLIAGGITSTGGGGGATDTAEMYDPTNGLFTAVAPMSSARAQHTATLLGDGTVLVTGGYNGHAANAPEDPPYDPLYAELFDPTRLSFHNTGAMSTTRIGQAAVLITPQSVLVMGGFIRTSKCRTAAAESGVRGGLSSGKRHFRSSSDASTAAERLHDDLAQERPGSPTRGQHQCEAGGQRC